MGVINFFRSIYKKKNLFISGNQVGKQLNVLKKVYKGGKVIKKKEISSTNKIQIFVFLVTYGIM